MAKGFVNVECPVCGNWLQVNTHAREFKCIYCRRPVKVKVNRIKGKYRIELEEGIQY